jgi:hypothetical protein
VTILIEQSEQNGAPPLREFICERLWCIRLHAENGERFAEIGDDVGSDIASVKLWLISAPLGRAS